MLPHSLPDHVVMLPIKEQLDRLTTIVPSQLMPPVDFIKMVLRTWELKQTHPEEYFSELYSWAYNYLYHNNDKLKHHLSSMQESIPWLTTEGVVDLHTDIIVGKVTNAMNLLSKTLVDSVGDAMSNEQERYQIDDIKLLRDLILVKITNVR